MTPSRVLVLAVYLAAAAGAVWLLVSARGRVLRELNTPAARAEWEAFRAAEQSRQNQGGQPVQRKVPTSGEPPALVLMRDYFSVVVAACLLLGSCLFWLIVLLLRGALRRGPRHQGSATSAD